MTTVLLTHSDCLYHEPPTGHPEAPDRLRAVLHALEDEAFSYLVREDAPFAEVEHLARVHPRPMIERVFKIIPPEELGNEHERIDADTYVSNGSKEAALRAAGACVRAVDLVASGEARNAFCAVRPPGHHAEPDTAMGFCLFNNIAVGAAHARAVHGLKRVAVMDFDVHHGNGTQAFFASDPDYFYVSTHQYPHYPGTGAASERGDHQTILNVPLPPGAGTDDFRMAMTDIVAPAIRAFDPDLLMISAGFDAHIGDPLGDLRFSTQDFAWATRELMSLADTCCGGRIVSALEGGYDLDALAASARAHVSALMGS